MDKHYMNTILKRFESEDACVSLLIEMKWPGGFECSRCQCRAAYTISTRRLPLFECRDCKRQHSLTAGTVMEGSRTTLCQWFKAIYIFASAEYGISAVRLSELIQVTYKTAWLMLHKLRDTLSQREANDLLQGVVRIQGGAYGSPFNPYTESDPKRYPLLAGGTISETGDISALRIQIVAPEQLERGYITKPAEQLFIRQHVSSEASEVLSQRFRMHMSRFRPLVRCIAEFGRWASDLFHGLGRQYLQAYANEYSFRFNARMERSSTFNPDATFDHVLRLCLNVIVVPSIYVLAQRYRQS